MLRYFKHDLEEMGRGNKALGGGELIGEEQAAWRLAMQNSGNRNLPDTVVRLSDYGLSWKDSSRAQEVKLLLEVFLAITGPDVRGINRRDYPLRSFPRFLFELPCLPQDLGGHRLPFDLFPYLEGYVL